MPQRRRYVGDISQLAIPILITQVAAVGRFFVGTGFIASLGTLPLAALALAAGVIQTTIAVSLGLLGGTSIVVSHNGSAKGGMHQSFYSALLFGAGLGVILTVLTWHFVPIAALLHLPLTTTTVGGGVVNLGPQLQGFFHAYAYGIIPFCLAAAIRYYLLGAGKPNFISLSNLFGFGICVLASYALIFGKFGLPALGLTGFAVACSLSFWLVLVALAAFVVKHRRELRLDERLTMRSLSGRLTGQMLKYGGPMSVMTSAEVLFLTVIVFLVHDYGAVQLAAYQVVMQIVLMASIWPIAIGQANSVLAARSWHDPGINVHRLYVTSQWLSAVSVLLLGAALLIFHGPLLAGFLHGATEMQAALAFLAAGVAVVVLESLRANGFGVLRGLKHAASPMFVLVGSYALVGLPLLMLVHASVGLPAATLLWVLAISHGLAALCYHFFLHRSSRFRDARNADTRA